MKGSSHAIAGAITGFAISTTGTANPISTIGLTTIGLTLLGSLMPDIDEENSTVNKILFPIDIKKRSLIKALLGSILLVTKISTLKYIGVVLILSIISARVRYKFSLWNGFQEFKYHRTFFHDPLIGGILLTVPLLGFNVPKEYIMPYLIGLASHYFLDSFTAYGLPLYILGKKRIRIPIINYHSGNAFMEYGILALYLISTVSAINITFKENVLRILSYVINL